MNVQVLAPGLATTLQAGARHGLRHLGVAGAGALDPYSHAVANLLAGNPADAPALEIILAGPRLRFGAAVRIAICGAAIDAEAEGRVLPGWRPVDLPARSTLSLGRCREGARAYLAVAGGFDPPMTLGSASTDLRGGFGGHGGRILRAGDALPLRASIPAGADALHVAPWWIDPSPDLDLSAPPQPIRVLYGRDRLAPDSALFEAAWQVAAASDRQGLRLQGPSLHVRNEAERLSEPVAPGTLQLPPDGQPILLLADAQTHGGYPRIAHAIRADRPRLAQVRPGDTLRFAPCTPEQAHRAAREQRQRLQRIALAIQARRNRRA